MVLMGNIRQSPDVRHIQRGVPHGFHIEEPGFRRNLRAERFGMRRVGELDRDSLIRQKNFEHRHGTAVQIRCRDKLVPGSGKREGRVMHGGCPRTRHYRGGSAFQGGKPGFENLTRGIAETGIDKPEVLEREEIGGMLRRIKGIRSRSPYRESPGSGNRIGSLPCMNR